MLDPGDPCRLCVLERSESHSSCSERSWKGDREGIIAGATKCALVKLIELALC
jgi:hypothetical protein